MKKLKNFLYTFICIVATLIIVAMTTKLMLQIFNTTVYADVGSFEDYSSSGSSSSGSSWSGSDWGGSSSWSSGSYSSSSDYDYDDDYDGPVGIVWQFGSIIFFLIIVYVVYKSKNTNNSNYFYDKKPNTDSMQSIHALEARQTQIENKIQVNDPDFNKEEFIAWSKNLFVKLQQAWTVRDWSTIRTFETESLFEQHNNQLQGYINNNQINVMDRICVNYAHLYGYRVEGDKEILTVRLNSRMEDYIIDATTKQVIKGQKGLDKVNTYLLIFIRKNGVKTKPGTTEVNTTNCPNCGAPTQITSSGKCEYCGSVITTGEYNWVLSNLQRETY